MKTKVTNLILAAAACTNGDNNAAVDNNAPVAARITAGMADGVKDITPCQLSATPTGFHGSYDAIILPDNYDDNALKVDFTLGNGETYIWNVAKIEFAPGHEYIYKVTITRTGVTAEGTIAPWQEEPKGEVKAE